MRVSVLLVTGVDPDPMAAAQLGLLWDAPHAVAVRHRIDVARGVLERVVSDLTGVIEHEETELEHACVSCALREDVLPTLDRLARDGRWRSIVVQLPVGAEVDQVCTVLARDPRLARRLRVAAVVTALDHGAVVEDLLGDDTMADSGRGTSEDDDRGVGDVACAMVEHADVVVLTGGEAPVAGDDEAGDRAVATTLVRTLARPDVPVLVDATALDAAALVADPPHRHGRTVAWGSHVREVPFVAAAGPGVWSLELRADLPFHPDRLVEDLESLAAGPWRTRGCFWLPTRPDRALLWEGAGGHLAIGDGEAWGPRPRRTHLTFVGVGERPAHLPATFESLLVPAGAVGPGIRWSAAEDGFEPWLGPIRDVA